MESIGRRHFFFSNNIFKALIGIGALGAIFFVMCFILLSYGFNRTALFMTLVFGLLVFSVLISKKPTLGLFLYIISLSLSGIFRIDLYRKTIAIAEPGVAGEGISLSFLFFLFVFCLWLMRILILGKSISFLKLPLIFSFTAFLTVTFISVIYAEDSQTAFSLYVRYIYWFLMYLMVISLVRNRLTLERILWCFIISAFVISLHSLYIFFIHKEVGYILGVYSLFRNKNAVGDYLIGIIPIALAMFLAEENRTRKLFLIVSILFSVLVLILLLSRAAWLAISLALLIFYLKNRKAAVFLIICVIIIISSKNFYPVEVKYAYHSFYDRQYDEQYFSSFNRREQGYKKTLDVFKRYPIWGVGRGNFRYFNDGFNSHSGYLGALVETGTIGFLAFLFLILKFYKITLTALRKLYRNMPDYKLLMGLIAGVTSILLHNIFSDGMNTAFHWFLFALAISGAIIYTAKPAKEPNLGDVLLRQPGKMGTEASASHKARCHRWRAYRKSV